MKKHTFPCLLATLLVLAASIAGPSRALADNLKLFIFAGQASMAGTGKAGDLPEGPVDLRAPQKDVLYAAYDSKIGGGLLEATGSSANPWTALQPLKETFGPEIEFGRTIVENLPQQHIAIVKVAVSGANLAEHWLPDAKAGPKLYSAMVDFVRDAIARREKAGDTVEVAGFIWYQGESDAHSEKMAAAYGENLSRLFARVRADFKSPDLPIVAVRIGIRERNAGQFESRVRTAIETVCSTEPHTAWVSVDRLPLADGKHLDSAGQLEAGQRLAAAWLKLVGTGSGHATAAASSAQ